MTCRLFARLGTACLFHTVTLRYSLASVGKAYQIAQDAQLRSLVRTLIWDNNLWRVGANVRDWHEWERYFNLRAKEAQDCEPEQSALYKELAESRPYWTNYLALLDEEQAAICEVDRIGRRFLGDLPSLQKIHVVKGAYHLSNGRICRAGDYDYTTIPVTVPLSSWRGDSFSRFSTMDRAYAFLTYAAKATKWRLNGITAADLGKLPAVLPGERLTSIRSIRIRLGRDLAYIYAHTDMFAAFLGYHCNLESLHIDLRGRVVGEYHMTRSIRTIQDTFEILRSNAKLGYHEGPVTWPKLRKLSLHHFDTTRPALLSLVARHNATLRDLRLHDISLFADNGDDMKSMSWPDVLKTLWATTNLDNLALSGEFLDRSFMIGSWILDDPGLAKAVVDWLVNGGSCPLTNDNKFPRVL